MTDGRTYVGVGCETKSFAKPETWRTTQMPYVLKNTFLPSYWEGLGGKMAIKNNASTGTPKAIGQKRRKTRENKASSTQISQRGLQSTQNFF